MRFGDYAAGYRQIVDAQVDLNSEEYVESDAEVAARNYRWSVGRFRPE